MPRSPASLGRTSSSFSFGLFDCLSDRALCVDTMLCYCCQVGRQFSAIEGYPRTHNWLMCCVACSFAEFVPCCLRCKVSDMYGIDEPCHESCAKGFFCCPCSVCVTGRELKARGLNPGGICMPSSSSSSKGSAALPPPPFGGGVGGGFSNINAPSRRSSVASTAYQYNAAAAAGPRRSASASVGRVPPHTANGHHQSSSRRGSAAPSRLTSARHSEGGDSAYNYQQQDYDYAEQEREEEEEDDHNQHGRQQQYEEEEGGTNWGEGEGQQRNHYAPASYYKAVAGRR